MKKLMKMMAVAAVLAGLLCGCAAEPGTPDESTQAKQTTAAVQTTAPTETTAAEQTDGAEQTTAAEETTAAPETTEATMVTVVLDTTVGGDTTDETEPPEQTQAPENTDTPEQEYINLQELYNEGILLLEDFGSGAPILFPETNVEYMNNFYPGLSGVEMNQFYAGVAPVTNAPFEIVLVEVADAADVDTVLGLFWARAAGQSENTSNPGYAEAWSNNCIVSCRGNYVFLAVLMEPWSIPSAFILD